MSPYNKSIREIFSSDGVLGKTVGEVIGECKPGNSGSQEFICNANSYARTKGNRKEITKAEVEAFFSELRNAALNSENIADGFDLLESFSHLFIPLYKHNDNFYFTLKTDGDFSIKKKTDILRKFWSRIKEAYLIVKPGSKLCFIKSEGVDRSLFNLTAAICAKNDVEFSVS